MYIVAQATQQATHTVQTDNVFTQVVAAFGDMWNTLHELPWEAIVPTLVVFGLAVLFMLDA